MNRPDPATDFVGSIKWLMEKFEDLERFLDANPERKITAAEAARRLGLPGRYFYQPWRIPGFAASGSLHTLTEWKHWMDEKSDRERRRDFDTAGLRKRKARATA
jgi:hypothetical protein